MKKNNQLKLNDTKIRITKNRKLILDLLSNAKRPLSHKEILSNKTISYINRVTIYRTLEILNNAGILHKIMGTDGAWRFCAHKEIKGKKCPGNHIHFLCSECSKMRCILEQKLPWIKPPKGFKVRSKQLVVYGTCAACLSKISKNIN